MLIVAVEEEVDPAQTEVRPGPPDVHRRRFAGQHDHVLKRKLLSCSHGQELGQLADLASDWLFTLVQPIRSQLIS